ncbi:phosphatase PAP2 family protein [Candidatus Woesearchaeota archaeon]|nr:phosphatase PAP2 family protein [Candidatus Woesearchaeota archaeon]
MAKRFTKLPKQLMSIKLLKLILDDFSFFGSIPFYIFVTLSAGFMHNIQLFKQLAYSFLIAFIITMVAKNVHYRDRPQKEEFTIFMEKMVAGSFPSTHSMNITLLAVFLSLSYPYAWVTAMFGTFSLMVYVQRYLTKKHFLTDIVGGILIAVAIAVFVVNVF